jgi:hypothetical protein
LCLLPAVAFLLVGFVRPNVTLVDGEHFGYEVMDNLIQAPDGIRS